MDTQLKPAPSAKKPASTPMTLSKKSPSAGGREEGMLDPKEKVMGFLDHLTELRDRLIRGVLGLVLTTLVSSVFAGRLLEYLTTPVGQEDFKLQTLGPTEGVVIYFRVALLAGAILAIPWITWQMWMFIAPGLKDNEKRYILMSLPASTLLFLVGVAFAWFILMPAALKFLQNFQSDLFKADWTAGQYVAFVTSLLFWIGVSFEMPLIFFVLGRMGLVGPRALRQNWRLAVVGSSVAAAMITPTVDPFNMMLVMGPLLTLYALSIVLNSIAFRRSAVGSGT